MKNRICKSAKRLAWTFEKAKEIAEPQIENIPILEQPIEETTASFLIPERSAPRNLIENHNLVYEER